VLSAVVLAPVGLVSVWYGGAVWAACLAILAVGLGMEWVGLCGIAALSLPGIAVPLALLAVGTLAAFGLPAIAGAALVVVAGTVALGSERPMLGAGIAYIGPGYLSLLLLRAGPAGLRNVLFLMLVVWGADIGAYLVGRLVGGPRLAPLISPGKTWSGALGGAACAILVGLLVGSAHPWRAAALAFALGVVAQGGDLLESAIKRHFGAKDSGWIVPGHGGLLDRLDGVLAAAPAALLWSFWIGWGRVLWQ
jgi:phosphatidate cytidylyltransferase